MKHLELKWPKSMSQNWDLHEILGEGCFDSQKVTPLSSLENLSESFFFYNIIQTCIQDLRYIMNRIQDSSILYFMNSEF